MQKVTAARDSCYDTRLSRVLAYFLLVRLSCGFGCFGRNKQGFSMKVALSTWQDRISPVFDVARQLLLAEVQNSRVISKVFLALDPNMDWESRVEHLAKSEIDVLICGAISSSLEPLLQARGIQVISHVCGPVDDVLRYFIRDGLADRRYQMPGCRGSRRCGAERNSGCGRRLGSAGCAFSGSGRRKGARPGSASAGTE